LVILALDTTGRAGSVAIARDGEIVDELAGDPARTHGQRLPGEIAALMERQRLRIGDIDLFAVASGPGSFTGLRVGIATVQGLAMATGRLVVPVPSLEAVAELARPHARTRRIAALIDAQRGEVFSALYEGEQEIDPPAVGPPAATLDRWTPLLSPQGAVFAGDGAERYQALVRARFPPPSELLDALPPLARAVARLAARRTATAVAPHAIAPIYVRRPDAELARDRRP
jgi:tRNA threonylcarbamoyladenosine biosynthesis protein TsaB